VQPNHDGALGGVAESGGPDVQDEAVFAGGFVAVGGGDFGDERRRSLRAAMAEIEYVADGGPRLWRNRRKKAARAVG
jgi:hypothetical protein